MIVLALALRVVLIALGWPPTNSDEGTMAIMARNIAYRGAHPSMYYGQNYMGVIEAYLGAGIFHLFASPSLFALRLGVVLMVTLFLVSTYLQTCLLFTPKLAFVTIAFLSVGSIPFLTRQTIATGGSSQTLLFGSVAFLLVSWLALTYRRDTTRRMILKRLAAYAGLGLVVGLGLWSDMVVVPVFAMAGLLLILFCWRELFTWGAIALLALALLGLQPLLRYDHAQGLNAWQILLELAHGSTSTAPTTLHGILHNIKATVLVSIPTATGSSFCPVIELPNLGDNSPHSLPCTIAHASWGGGYLLLLTIALLTTMATLWRIQYRNNKQLSGAEGRYAQVQRVSQLLLVGAALLTISVYTLSSGPVSWPSFHARYLIGLLITTPALIEPVWRAASSRKMSSQWIERTKMYGSRILLVTVWCILLGGTVVAFSEVPEAQGATQQRNQLISSLLRIGANRIYTEYWACNDLAFASNERIICAVVDDNLQPSHNRVPGYYALVHADRSAAYVCPIDASNLPAGNNCLPAVKRMVARAAPGTYRYYEFDGYGVYQPINS